MSGSSNCRSFLYMDKEELEFKKKVLEAKMLLDTFEMPKRPISLSAHQYKKKFGSNQGYAQYKRKVREDRKEWDLLYKSSHKVLKQKLKYLTQVELSDDALQQAELEASERFLSVPEILSEWLESGREQSQQNKDFP